MLLNCLAFRANMRAALADDDSLNSRSAARAGLAGAPEDLQLIAIAALMFGN
jgi:hypothetical protein